MKIHRHIAIPLGQATPSISLGTVRLSNGLPAMGRHSLLRAILSAEVETKAEAATAAERGRLYS